MSVNFGQTVPDLPPRSDLEHDDLVWVASPNDNGGYTDYKVTQQDLTKKRLVSKTANYTIQADDDVITGDATGGAITITLPTASGIEGVVKTIKRLNSGGNAVTVACNGAETIDGSATKSLSSQYASVTVISNGTNWLVIG